MSFQKIKIEGKEYFIVDSIQNLRAEDSFIYNKNKLALYTGSGEARKYVGSYIGNSGTRLSEFFEYSNWGNTKVDGKRTYPIIQQENCFFSKSNLLKYLYDARIEYQSQEQVYNHDISAFYSKYLEEVNQISKEVVFFSIYDVSDFLENDLSRGYIRSDDEIWKTWRKMVLPKISYLSILKIVPVIDPQASSRPLFYFRVFLDYQFRAIVHPSLGQYVIEKGQTSEPVSKITKATNRQGADKYRRKVIDHMPQCPFTRITDEKLLIASHIKPYNICMKEGREDQALDYLNGLALTPTYDKLFDQGYITFTNDGELICGTLLSEYTWERLNINPNSKNKLRIYPENRGEYLEYHQRFVFQDDFDEISGTTSN